MSQWHNLVLFVLISEIEDVSRYGMPYTGKRHNMSQAKIDAFQNINMKWVKTWHDIWYLNNMYNLAHINENIIWFLNDMYHLTCYTFIFTSTKQNTLYIKTDIKNTTILLLSNSYIKCSYNQHSTKGTKTIPMMTMMTIMYGRKNSNWKTICQHGLIFIKNNTMRYL